MQAVRALNSELLVIAVLLVSMISNSQLTQTTDPWRQTLILTTEYTQCQYSQQEKLVSEVETQELR